MKDVSLIRPMQLPHINSFLKAKGFTLIEVLLAIFIFAIVLSTIYASYSGTFGVIGMTEPQAEIYRKARIAMQRIVEDLESSYYSMQEADFEEFLGIDKEINGFGADTLRFISKAHLIFSDKDKDTGIAVIEYEVRENETEDGLILFRHDTPEFFEEPDEGVGGLVLCDDLLAVHFAYVDAAGETYDNWDSTREDFAGKSPRERIPRMVSITLQFRNDSEPEAPHSFMTSVVLPISRE